MSRGDALGWLSIGASLYQIEQAKERRNKLLEYVGSDPLNPDIHKVFLAELNSLKALALDGPELRSTYSSILKILIEHPQNPELADLVYQASRWYFNLQDPPRDYTLEDFSKVQNLLAKKQTLEKGIQHLEKDQSEKYVDRFSPWIGKLNFENFEDNVVKSEVLALKSKFLNLYSTALLKKLIGNPKDTKIRSLTKEALEKNSNPDPSIYEDFLLSLLQCMVENPKDKDLKAFLMYSLEKAPGMGGVSSLNVYNTVLDLFEDSEFQKDLRILVLDVGRWHFSRKNWLRRSPKPEDEQQMQNDILMRLKH